MPDVMQPSLEQILNSAPGDTLNEKLQCAFANIGSQVGDLIRCMVTQEISANMGRINQLNSILNGNICDTTSN